MAKTKTFVSDQGEIFEGTQAELMKSRGIKHKMGFSRKSGAVDADGDRWLSEDKYNSFGGFMRPVLYLGPRRMYGKCYKTGGPTRWVEGESETAGIYNLYKRCLAGEVELFDWDIAEECREFIARVDAQYNVIDNNLDNNPYTQELKHVSEILKQAIGERRALSVRHMWSTNFTHIPELSPEEEEKASELAELEAILVEERNAIQSKSNRWEERKMREANDKIAINRLESITGEKASDKHKAAIAGKLTEYLAGEWSPA